MKVVNLRKEKHTVYIGRAGHGLDGVFGNPVKINSTCLVCDRKHKTGGATLPCYEQYLRTKLQNSTAFRMRFMELQEDDILGCFCKPNACHGDVMIKVWERMNEEV